MSEDFQYVTDQINDTSWSIADGPARAFLFIGTEKALLVDSGYGSGDLKKTVADLTPLPVILVNTHADYDHIGGNSQFDEAFMHPSEFARYRHELSRFYPSIEKEFPVYPLWEGDIIDLGGRSFEVFLIPGHSPGSIALLDINNRALIGGDSLLDDVIAMCDTWRDFDAYICSMEKLKGKRDRFDTIYTSHGSFPLSPGVIDGLISGALRCKNGEIEGVVTDFIKDREGLKIYDTGTAKFMF